MTGNWLAYLDDDDKAGFFAEMRASLNHAVAAGDITPLEVALAAWKATAEALSDPQRREVLTSPLHDPEAFAEAERPGEWPLGKSVAEAFERASEPAGRTIALIGEFVTRFAAAMRTGK